MITYWMSWVPVRANAGLRQGSNKSFSLLEDMKSKCTGKKAKRGASTGQTSRVLYLPCRLHPCCGG